MRRTILPAIFAVLLTVLILFCGQHAHSRSVDLPVTLEYPLLESLITSTAFPEPGGKSTLVNEGNGCITLILSEPSLSEHQGLSRFEVAVQAQVGTPLGESCLGPPGWSGYLIFYQKPWINPQNWQLSFTTLSTEILDVNRNPQVLSRILWSFIEPRVIEYLNSLTIDLKVPVDELKAFLMPLFPEHVARKTELMLDSMRPGAITINETHIGVNITAEVEEVYSPDETKETRALEHHERQQLTRLWESWDSMLSHIVTLLSREILSEEEQHILIEVLLSTRHHFVSSLSDNSITQALVREQFVEVWQQLSPIFRNHLYKKKNSVELLGYLAFVSSSDALLVFDRLGPTFGIEISRDGLIRLMHMLNSDPSLLEYPQGDNPDLQKLFQLEDSRMKETSLFEILLELATPSAAVAAELPSFKEILKWKVPAKDKKGYIDRVDSLLNTSAEATLVKKKVPVRYSRFFRSLIPAMAWLESCYRQFEIRDGKLTYLLSSNKSSVGIMQVNERVWRGIYSRQRLRWDITYNSRAGAEIAALYLTRYGLKDKSLAAKLTEQELAGLVYALYNGGPSQYTKYRHRLAQNKLYPSDKLFSQKFKWVVSGERDQLAKCLVGG